MEALNAYEILDQLSEKSKMFKMINDNFIAKDEKIKDLESQLDEITLILGDAMLGGM